MFRSAEFRVEISNILTITDQTVQLYRQHDWEVQV